MPAASIYEGGFAHPVFQSQAAFRLLMEAMANPGVIIDLGGGATAPSPLTVAAAVVLAALADGDAAVWFEEPAEAAAAWLAFHTGAPATPERAAAAFAVLAPQSPVGGWSAFAAGTSSYPDASATLLLPVTALRGGPPLTLRGPGIEAERALAPQGLPQGFAQVMADNRARYPLGFDLLLVCGSELAALPRTARIREA